MCCCAKPNKNGEPGYSWDGKQTGVRPTNGPDVLGGDTVLWDEPGRCRPQIGGNGGIDFHSYHFRIVGHRHGSCALMVRHGAGDETIALSRSDRVPDLLALLPDSDARFLFLHALYSAHSEAESAARASESHRWRSAIADGRARKRRYPKRGTTRVWIEDGPRIYDTEEGKV